MSIPSAVLFTIFDKSLYILQSQESRAAFLVWSNVATESEIECWNRLLKKTQKTKNPNKRLMLIILFFSFSLLLDGLIR